MATRPLPATVTLHGLKRRAKTLMKAVRAGDAAALARVAPYFPGVVDFRLQHVHLAMAREYGFSTWTSLKADIDGRRLLKVGRSQLVNRFLSLVTVSYFSNIPSDPARFEEAAALLAAHPEIADASLHVAAAIGDAERVRLWLDGKPRHIERPGGPYRWPPLLYAAYARLPGRSSLPAARVLIERGADPKVFFLDDGRYRFTALTGVFGEGEAGKVRQPEHPDVGEFARLLLDAGAAANDSQALYNRMFEPDNSCLELLLAHGLNADDRNNWLTMKNGQLGRSEERVFDYQLAWALEKRMSARVRLLVEHGADVNRPIKRRTPYEWAMLTNERELAAYLVGKGAAAVEIRVEDRQHAAIFNGVQPLNDTQFAALAAIADPRETRRAHPAMLHEAAAGNAVEAVRRMLRLGFDVNAMTTRAPLHEAALHGHLDMARRLVDSGADTTIRDPHFHAPPIEWAEYNGQVDMVRFLETQPLDVFAAAARGRIEQLHSWLVLDPSLLDIRFGQFRAWTRTPDHGWMTPLGFAIFNRRFDAVRFLLSRGADRTVADAAGRSYADLARELECEDIAALLASADPIAF